MEPGRRRRTKSYFRYKLHGTMDEDFGRIRRIKVTNAKVHDSQTDAFSGFTAKNLDASHDSTATKSHLASSEPISEVVGGDAVP